MKFIPYGLHWIDDEDIKELNKILMGNWITTGPTIGKFENALCSYLGCKHSVAVNSGTSALDIAVQALDLPVGSEIITTPFTFMATSNAILYNDSKPVFVDIQKETRNIDPREIKKRITDKTKAIIYVDFAGHPCEIEEIKTIADENELFLIEDACHAIGAEYNGNKIGNFADMTIFSFHPVKHITTGEGGAVSTNDDGFYEKLKILRNHGIDKGAFERFGPKADWAYDQKYLGRNYRITDFQAALGISQLKKLHSFIDRRTKIAEIYNDAFKDLAELEIPMTKDYVKHSWHIYTILLKGIERDEFFKRLRSQNIGVNVHYIPIYRFSYYQNRFGIDSNDYPITEEVFHRIITLPLFPKMTNEEVDLTIENVKKTLYELKKDKNRK